MKPYPTLSEDREYKAVIVGALGTGAASCVADIANGPVAEGKTRINFKKVGINKI